MGTEKLRCNSKKEMGCFPRGTFSRDNAFYLIVSEIKSVISVGLAKYCFPKIFLFFIEIFSKKIFYYRFCENTY